MSSRPHILALDLLRGYFLLVIFIDHLFRFTSIFSPITGQGQLWVSAAESFFLISGLLVGYLNQSPSKLVRRSLKLYSLSVAFTLLFTIWGKYLPLNLIKSGLYPNSNLSEILTKAISLQYVYGWADFLSFYSVFILFSIFALKIKPHFTIIISLSLWYFFRNYSHFFTWQLIFFTGLIIGQNLNVYELVVKKYSKIIYVVTIISFMFSTYIVHQARISLPIFDKNTLGFGRYLLSLVWFATYYNIFLRYDTSINKFTFGIFKTLGQNSLFVYCLEAVILFPINFLVVQQFNWFGNSLYTMILCYFLYKITQLKLAL